MLNGSYFCTLGLSLETVILPVDESPGSLERAEGTGYKPAWFCWQSQSGVSIWCSFSAAQGWSCYHRRKYSTGFPRADLVNAKFTSKGNILSACQWLKAIWLSLAVCFPKNRKGTALGPGATTFMGTLEAHVLVCRGFGEKSLRSGVMLALGQKNS